ncbi:peptide/nickel transport system permease protein [Neobacillus niacini]|uniref:ABC transporter permease n=1 Tax=Neobacillus niacini TaxID=86668 RepID=UPI0010518952|nr:ABC transporter permease [Neobacillus niacini]MDR7075136.1 peptide/nickel transport system permease protein [Neobacillus niacini]
MIAFIIRRLLQTVIVLIMVSLIVFSILQVLPGDPARTLLGPEASPEQVEQIREELGLNRSLPVQYFTWVGHAIQGDLGKSIAFREDVTGIIGEHLPKTIYISILSMVLAIIIGVPAGIIAAIKRGGKIDSLISVVANFGMAVPAFWLAVLCIYFFSLKLGWFPVQGYTSPFEDLWLSTQQVIMPVICLAFAALASFARQTRSAMLEVIMQDFTRTARSKGLKEGTIIIKHTLKNAIIPVITLVGLQVRNIVGSTIFIEQVFNIPGMGRLVVQSIFNQDFVVVQGCVLVIAIIVALTNLLIDISYGYADPRIRIK